MAEVHGQCNPQFDKVRSLLQQFIESGEEVGACITVNIDGEDVVNIWGGLADAESKRPWAEDTIVGVASNSKTVSSLAMLMLVDSGAVSVYDKVSKYWPEFAANGKENVEIRHLLSHTSGVAGWDEEITMDEICDPVTSSAKLAAQAPWWEPGTASAYHAVCNPWSHPLPSQATPGGHNCLSRIQSCLERAPEISPGRVITDTSGYSGTSDTC